MSKNSVDSILIFFRNLRMSETGGKLRRKEWPAKIRELQSKLKILSDKLKVTHNKLAEVVWVLVVCMAALFIMGGLFTWSNTSLKTAKTAIQELENRLNEAKRINSNLQTEMDNLRPKYEYLDSMFVDPNSAHLSFPATRVLTLDRNILMAEPIVCTPVPQQYVQYENGLMTSILYATKHVCKNSAWESSPLSIHDVSTPTNDTDFIRCFILEDDRILPETCTIHVQSGQNRPLISKSTIYQPTTRLDYFLMQIFSNPIQFSSTVLLRFSENLDNLVCQLFDFCFFTLLEFLNLWFSILSLFFNRFVLEIIVLSLPALLFYRNVLLKCIKDGTLSSNKWVRNERIMDMRIRFAKWLKKGMQKKKIDVETDLKPVQHVSSVEEKEASTIKDPKLPSEETESNVEVNPKKVWVLNHETSEFEKVDASQIDVSLLPLLDHPPFKPYIIKKTSDRKYILVECVQQTCSDEYLSKSYTKLQILELKIS